MVNTLHAVPGEENGQKWNILAHLWLFCVDVEFAMKNSEMKRGKFCWYVFRFLRVMVVHSQLRERASFHPRPLYCGYALARVVNMAAMRNMDAD